MTTTLPDIKPQSSIESLDREKYANSPFEFDIRRISSAVGMSESFIRKVCLKRTGFRASDVLRLLDLDCYRETFIPRSKVIEYLIGAGRSSDKGKPDPVDTAEIKGQSTLLLGNAIDHLKTFRPKTVRCVVTSTPYWGMRIYKNPEFVTWADGEVCPFGHEQTPEAFARHTTEVLLALYDVITDDGSIWWNVMDTFNTRTQIRGNASEALKAMQGKDRKSWADHQCRRYSAGHSFLKDGEQCLIPGMIAERASRIGFYVKSVITWAKTSALPEPQGSRVSRNLEYIIHLSKKRTPHFKKEIYRSLPASLGGRNNGREADKLSDVWVLPTSSGRDGHGAQFPISLPARCIALSSDESDLILDPFVGAGNSGLAALALRRRFIGVDVSEEYLKICADRMARLQTPLPLDFPVTNLP